MPTFGHISEFVVDISAYLKWVELYLGANDITAENGLLSF